MEKVKKSHHLITAGFNLSAREQDLLTLMFKDLKSFVDSHKFDEKGKLNPDFAFENLELKTEFRFSVKELIKDFNLSRQGLYDALDSATDSIMNKQALVKSGKGTRKSFKKYTLCSYSEFENGQLLLRVDKATAALMLDYSKGFSEVDFHLSLALTGGYDKRILDLINRFKDNGKGSNDYSVTLSEFYRMMGTNPKKYINFQSFRKTVLDASIKRLIAASNGMWTAKKGFPKGYIIEKSGRSYKDTNKITFKLLYCPPKELLKVNADQDTKETGVLPLEVVYDTLKNQYNGTQSIDELGLDKESIGNFMMNIGSSAKYTELAPILMKFIN